MPQNLIPGTYRRGKLLGAMDARGIPFDVLVLVIIVMPICVAVFFGLFAFRNMTPLVFRCRRCAGEFSRKPWLRFPTSCAICGARDWNARKDNE